MNEHENSPATPPTDTANDHLKKTFSSFFWAGMILATGAHFGIFNFWPELQAEDVSFTADEIEVIDVPDEIEIPPPPQAIRRPAVPVVSTTIQNEELTIDLTTFEANPAEELPPPPELVEEDAPTGGFSVFTVSPRTLNVAEVRREIEARYPPLLRDAGIGGTVRVRFQIDEEGKVIGSMVAESSGHTALDEAALLVAPVFRFSPALNRDKAVRVQVEFPVTFQIR